MPRTLNTAAIREAMAKAGLNASALADALDVSRQAITTWLKGTNQPRPDKVLKLSRLLELPYDSIYQRDLAVEEPAVAYRKKGGAVTKDAHLVRAKRMGKVLESLVPCLPFDEFHTPSRIKNPSLDSAYLDRLVGHLRKARGLSPVDEMPFEALVGEFTDRQAVLVPVLWGEPKQHGNALHIYLPRSQVTWVYLNLETHILDFKFWMAHELGHILLGEEVEIDEEAFCESFAANLLFPRPAAEECYEGLNEKAPTKKNLNRIKEWALQYEVSPITISRQLNAYAEATEQPVLDFGKDIYKMSANLNKSLQKVSQLLFTSSPLQPDEFIAGSERVFGKVFFDSLRKRLSKGGDGAGLVQWVMDIPLADAKGIADRLR
ncbi:MAG: XRE family transcriptional regulator [Opitutales bacterium]|nr:XRE family transcriptional regulator [Opitutales bacterium]